MRLRAGFSGHWTARSGSRLSQTTRGTRSGCKGSDPGPVRKSQVSVCTQEARQHSAGLVGPEGQGRGPTGTSGRASRVSVHPSRVYFVGKPDDGTAATDEVLPELPGFGKRRLPDPGMRKVGLHREKRKPGKGAHRSVCPCRPRLSGYQSCRPGIVRRTFYFLAFPRCFTGIRYGPSAEASFR